MDKLLVEIFIPASNQTLDVWIPKESKLFEVTELLANTVLELSGGELAGADQMVICERQTGKILNINLTIEELGFIHGSKLMLL